MFLKSYPARRTIYLIYKYRQYNTPSSFWLKHERPGLLVRSFASSSYCPAMPLVCEMMHPRGFSFAAQRKIVLLREVRKLSWDDISKQVLNLSGKRPRPRHCANYYRKFNRRLGRTRSQYANCGRQPWKVTKKVVQFLLRRLKELRRSTPVTSTTLQIELARAMSVHLAPDYIRKILTNKGYRWLPRRQKRIYSAKDKKKRIKFAAHVLNMTKAELREKLSLAMDGTVLAMPPADKTDRINFCRHGEEFMWRKPSEAFRPDLAGKDPYPDQLPLCRAVPLWGGISSGGFAAVALHPRKKITKQDWAKLVDAGCLTAAIRALTPVRPHGPWHVLCDNEGFLHAKESSQAHRTAGVKLWHIPPRSPDLNPVERFWSWLKKKLRGMDLADAVDGRPLLGKMAYKARVRRVIKSKKAQDVAKSYANSLRNVCKAVLKKKGAASGY